MLDLAVRCDYLLTQKKGETKALENYLLGIRGEKIVAVEPFTEAKFKTARKAVYPKNSVVMPGLINAHTHLPMVLFRGLADDLSFHEWLFNNILPLEGRVVNPEFVKLGTELALLEMIASGTTCMAEMFYYNKDVADVVADSGLRGLIGQSILDFPVPDNKKQDGNDYRIMDELYERYHGHERIAPTIAPHSPYSCSDATLKKALAYAQKKNLRMHIHLAETKKEVDDSFTQYGVSPVQRFKNLGLMDVPCLLAHCVHLSEEDTDILAGSPCSPVYNPESNMKIAVGAAPIRRYLDRGIRVALGTDSAASNNDLSLFKEMDIGAKYQKAVNGSSTALTAVEMLRMATLDGAHALGMEDKVGSLEVGKLADFITLSLDPFHMQPVHNLVSTLVYSANGSEVRNVVCHGKFVMEDGKILTLDPEGIQDRVKFYRQKEKF